MIIVNVKSSLVTPSFQQSSMGAVDSFMQKAKNNKLLTSEEVETFLKKMSDDKTCRFIEDIKNQRIKVCGKAAYEVLNELIKEYPSLLDLVFVVRDAKGQLVFPHFTDFLAFMSLPYFQWTFFNSENLKIDINRIKDRLEGDLTALRYLCSQIDSRDDLLEHLIALRAYEVPFYDIRELDLTRHPKEVAFYYHCKPFNYSKQLQALILVANPKCDLNEATTVSPRLLDFYRQLAQIYQLSYRVISKTEEIKTIFETLLKGDDTKLLVLEGHGTFKSIQFDSNEFINSDNLSSIPFYLLPEGVQVLLQSCKTGKGENPIAQKIANVVKGLVYAPDANSTGHPKVEIMDGNVVGFKSTDPYFNILQFSPKE